MSTEALGGLFILFGFALFVASIVLWVWALIDAVRRSQTEWRTAGQDRAVWLVVLIGSAVVSFGWLAALAYLVVARPRLQAAAPYVRA